MINLRSSNHTGRVARDMQSAFGPYTSRDLHPMPEPRDYSAHWWYAIALIALAALILTAIYR